MAGKTGLYIVATPIGNLGDLSQRAIDILGKVDVIACEDTRVTGLLLNKLGIKTKLIQCHKFNEKQSAAKIADLILKEDKTVALVSDAGTPLVSDPGKVLLEEIYNLGIKVTSIPGASAVTTFLSMLPRDDEFYTFGGFLPRTEKEQSDIFKIYKNTDFIFYETAQRLLKTLENIKIQRGENAKVAVGRELTKIYEEVKIDSVQNMIDYYSNNILKGEIVVLLYRDEASENDETFWLEKIKTLKSLNYSDKDISVILSNLYSVNKNKIYKLSINDLSS